MSLCLNEILQSSYGLLQNDVVLVTQSGSEESQFNAIGQMVEQTENGNTMKVSYNAYGIVSAIKDASNVLQVSYHYDDGGNRIKNTYYEGGVASRNDFYIHDASGNVMAIYQQALPGGQPILKELPIYGAGRVAVYKPEVNVCFYELNDHLGNVRGVIGVPETDTYIATMETENMGLETQVFTNIDPNNIVPFVSANQTAGGNEVVRLNSTYPIGPSKSLKVSPGDVVDLEVYAYYEAASGYGSTSTTVAALVGAVSGVFGGVMGGLGESGMIYNGVDDAIAATGVPTNPGDTRPAAYLEYILFDASYNFIARGWQVVPASANFAKQKIQFPASISITEPGYLFTYVSYDNESTNWVYFDELKITHTHSNIVAGADFYPFGLVMEGREITDEDYRFGYQGQYAEKDSVSGWNNFQLRMYDPRFGRWISPDPYGQFASPYVGMGNNPVLMSDRDGGFAGCPECDALKAAGIISSDAIVLGDVIVHATREGSRAIGNAILNGSKASIIRAASRHSGGLSSEFDIQYEGIEIPYSQEPIPEQFTDNLNLNPNDELWEEIRNARTFEMQPTLATGSIEPVAWEGYFLPSAPASSAAKGGGYILGAVAKNYSISQLKRALLKVHKILGGSLPKSEPGKFGSPQRGSRSKGYRLDPAHPPSPGRKSEELVPHVNWWNYKTMGKRKNNPNASGVVPILKPKN